MWVFSKIGFYSAVQKRTCKPDEVEVRSRCRGDLERLNRAVKGKYKITSNGGTDYPFRLRMPKEKWALFVCDQALKIDYCNFKDTIGISTFETMEQKNRRHNAYMGVWRAMLALEETMPKKGKRTWSNYRDEYMLYNRPYDDVFLDSQDRVDMTEGGRTKAKNNSKTNKH
jgi:hypothetical protein